MSAAPLVQVSASQLLNGVEISVSLTMHAQALQLAPEAASRLLPAGSTADASHPTPADRFLSAVQSMLAPAHAAALQSLASVACDVLEQEVRERSNRLPQRTSRRRA